MRPGSRTITRRRNVFRLFALTFVHFSVDFYGGLLIPLPEPTLINHFSARLGTVALLVGGSALLVNGIQPVAGWLLPKRGMPILTVLCPPIAAGIALVGMSRSLPVGAALLIVAGLGIGVLHPEATLAAHHLAGKRKGLGVSVFLSGGYFGFALGSLVAGAWVKHFPQLEGFWIFGFLALAASGLGLAMGLHRIHGHLSSDETETVSNLSYVPVLAMGICIASTMLLLVRLIPIYFVRLFPEGNGQFWGAASVSITGISGALGAYLWGHLSDRWGCAKAILVAQLLGLPFLYGLFHLSSPTHGPFWAASVGITTGAVFPLTVVLARNSRGLSQRLRMGLAIGATWGMGELLFILAGYYIDRFPASDPDAAGKALGICWVLVLGSIGLSLLTARRLKSENASG